MAYRRKQGIQRSATFVEDHRQTTSSGGSSSSSPAIASPRATRFADDSRRPERSSPLAARGGDLSLPVFGERFSLSGAAAAASLVDSQPSSPMQDPVTQLYTSTTKLNDDGPKYDLELSKKDDARHGLWSLVAQKAKVMLDENGTPRTQPSESRWSYDRVRSSESPTSRKGSSDGKLDIGGKIKNVLEEGLAAADNTTPGAGSNAVVAQKLQIRRKACSMDFRSANLVTSDMSPRLSDDVESPQIKASRDVANAMAAKVKLLQRELKTLKADLAFSKERCAQLEEENRQLRDGNQDADEDMEEEHQAAGPRSPSTRHTESPRMPSPNSGGAMDIVSPRMVNTDSGGAMDDKSPRVLSTNSGAMVDHESPRMLSTNSGAMVDHESPRMLSTNSGGSAQCESPMLRSSKDDGSSPETATDG
ncbi:hypothetical protein HU200_031811 [Digitaria exilis]|uniref:Uncharacterized protein n=1 Tax=Digitaria exilis TaxID=1010633 RepID=A0A835EPS1_9POAL|nr:hypothetical protein HU200_031811 [Digitaria exilis]